MSIKPPLMLLEDSIDKETRYRAAIWEFSDRAIAVMLQLSIFPFLPKIGKLAAKNILKLNNPEAIQGAVRFTEFALGTLLLNTMLVPFYNSKFLTRGINYISEKLTGEKYMPGKELEEQEQKEKFQNKIRECYDNNVNNSSISGKALTATSIVIDSLKKTFSNIMKPYIWLRDKAIDALVMPFSEERKTQNEIVDNKPENTIKKSLKMLSNGAFTLLALGLISRKMGPAAGKKLEKFFIKESKVSLDQNILRILVAEAIIKPALILANGDPYMAMRKFFDKVIGVGLLFASSPLIKKMTGVLSKNLKLSPKNAAGLGSLITAVVQVGLVLNVALTLINNKITGNLFKLINKEKEENYQENYRHILSSLKLNDTNNNPFKAGQPRSLCYGSNNNPFKEFESESSRFKFIPQG